MYLFACIEGGENNLPESVLFFHQVGSRDQMHGIRFSSKCPLSPEPSCCPSLPFSVSLSPSSSLPSPIFLFFVLSAMGFHLIEQVSPKLPDSRHFHLASVFPNSRRCVTQNLVQLFLLSLTFYCLFLSGFLLSKELNKKKFFKRVARRLIEEGECVHIQLPHEYVTHTNTHTHTQMRQ